MCDISMSNCCFVLLFSRENCDDKMTQFLNRCFYHSGQYNSEDHFSELDCKLKEKEVRTSNSCSVVCTHTTNNFF